VVNAQPVSAQPEHSALRAVGSREHNLGTLFQAVLTRGPLSRRDAARLTGLSPAAVTKLSKPLIAHGYLVENDREAGVPGRPQIPLAVVATRHYAIGVKVMTGEIVGVLADLHGETQSSHRIKLADASPDAVVDAVDALTTILLEASPVPRDKLLGIGIGLSGHVNGATGVLREASLLGWRDVPLRRLVADRTGLPVVIDNDVNTLAVAEQWFGPGSGYASFAVVTVGLGVGCGLVLDGQLWQGVSGAAGEFGHLLVDPAGPECHCGKRGCLESIASDDAIVRATAKATGRSITRISQVVTMAHQGDPAARQVFTDAGTALGRAMAALVSLLNPPLIILSGERITASDLFIDALRAEFERDAFSTTAQECTLLIRPLPDETWARGAAATMLRQGVLRLLGDLPDVLAS
jgi:predicted NBD/HSP70 family sugar kinase